MTEYDVCLLSQDVQDKREGSLIAIRPLGSLWSQMERSSSVLQVIVLPLSDDLIAAWNGGAPLRWDGNHVYVQGPEEVPGHLYYRDDVGEEN
jgi:hypothetical protein